MTQLPIFQRALQHASRTAIRSAEGTHTYAQLVAESQAVAFRLLGESDDLREARVAFLVPPGAGYVAALWGVWRAGGVAVPLSLSATSTELEYSLADSQASAVVVASELADRISDLRERQGLRVLVAEDMDAPQRTDLASIATDRRAMILYTSGTTSKPKGVVTTHACIQAQIESLIEAWQWQADDRLPSFLPLHHIHGIINVVMCALWAGAEIESFPRFDLEAVFKRVAENAYTLFMAVPTIYHKMIQKLEGMAPDERAAVVQGFAGMRLMVSGSAALPASVHEKWTELTGQRLLERYGMTEIGMALSNPYAGERRPGSVGQPLPGVQVRLRGEADVSGASGCASGEIQVRGPGVFKEYWNRPETTLKSFVDGWFATGDMAVVEDGYYRIMGRRSVDIIKSGGYKLSALEIEASLLDHPAIAQCAVVGVADEQWGETVASAVVLAVGQTLNLESLQSWCKDRLSSYKTPRALLIVEQLPRNAMGKVEKPAVTRLFAEG